jgi:DNA ligase 1
VQLAEIVGVSGRVAETPARLEKIALLADVLSRLTREEAAIGVSYLSGAPRQARLGVGYATVYGVEVKPAESADLELIEVDRFLEEISGTHGAGSKARREQLLTELLERATNEEQLFLRGMMLRNLRQGALEGVMADAVAVALGTDPKRVRRSAMLEGDLVAVAARALVEGADSLASSSMAIFTPLQPMLAKTSSTAGEAVTELGEAVVEQKLDGLRIQVHRLDENVAVYSRSLRDITSELPGVVAGALHLDASSFILDGEGLMFGSDGIPLAFQDTMSRPGEGGGSSLDGFYFDILHLDGEDLVDTPLRERRSALERLLPESLRIASIVTDAPEVADRFFTDTVSAGFEGVVVKDLDQPYEAGRRGSGWLKVKPTHTVDLVILAAEWGSGRREGWLSNLHLGAKGPDGGFVMLGKTFKGLTDEMLEWQTAEFLSIEDRREGHVVYLKPQIVYEIAFDGVQRSTRYPGGVTLRFARVKRFREDKGPADADTLETVRSHLR